MDLMMIGLDKMEWVGLLVNVDNIPWTVWTMESRVMFGCFLNLGCVVFFRLLILMS